MLPCPECDARTEVVESRVHQMEHVYRRRKCSGCGWRGITSEMVTGQYDARIRRYTSEALYLRQQARAEAAETGEDVTTIYERWGVA